MSKVTSNMSMSLDGFSAGPNVSLASPLGDGGERLHDWMFGDVADSSRKVVDESFETAGAIVMGRRMFEVGKPHWDRDTFFRLPVFVLTHRARDTLAEERGSTFTFLTDGVVNALAHAKAAAGDNDVVVEGGPRTVQGFIRAGLLDELQINLVPVLLRSGIRLFNRGEEPVGLERVRVVESSDGVTHLTFRVVKAS